MTRGLAMQRMLLFLAVEMSFLLLTYVLLSLIRGVSSGLLFFMLILDDIIDSSYHSYSYITSQIHMD